MSPRRAAAGASCGGSIGSHCGGPGARSRRLCAGAPFDINDFDGFVIGGGDDIDAALYRGEIEPAIRIDRERDAFELDLLESAAARSLPVLGICRGAQMINVFLGGSLHESIYAAYPGIPRLHSPLPSKRIEVVPHSILHGLLRSERERINALHHQSIDVLGAGLSIVARDQYGIVQAIERPGDPFLLGVQWHPEFMLFNRGQQRLFAAIAETAAAGRPPANYYRRPCRSTITLKEFHDWTRSPREAVVDADIFPYRIRLDLRFS